MSLLRQACGKPVMIRYHFDMCKYKDVENNIDEYSEQNRSCTK